MWRFEGLGVNPNKQFGILSGRQKIQNWHLYIRMPCLPSLSGASGEGLLKITLNQNGFKESCGEIECSTEKCTKIPRQGKHGFYC
jgi:hypothetical protein